MFRRSKIRHRLPRRTYVPKKMWKPSRGVKTTASYQQIMSVVPEPFRGEARCLRRLHSIGRSGGLQLTHLLVKRKGTSFSPKAPDRRHAPGIHFKGLAPVRRSPLEGLPAARQARRCGSAPDLQLVRYRGDAGKAGTGTVPSERMINLVKVTGATRCRRAPGHAQR